MVGTSAPAMPRCALALGTVLLLIMGTAAVLRQRPATKAA